MVHMRTRRRDQTHSAAPPTTEGLASLEAHLGPSAPTRGQHLQTAPVATLAATAVAIACPKRIGREEHVHSHIPHALPVTLLLSAVTQICSRASNR